MIAKLFIVLGVIGIIISHHQSNGHAISIDNVKEKGVEAITAVKVASDKIGAAATVPLELLKKKAIHAVKVPITLAKKKLAAGLALKKAKIIAPVILFKAAKKAIEAKIAKKKLKLSALKETLAKHVALAKLLKLAKIPILLWKLKLPIVAIKKAIKAHQKKKVIAWEALEHAAKLAATKKLGVKDALTNKLPSLPIPVIQKETDLGLSALLSGAIPFIGSSVNINNQHKIPEVLYQFIPDHASHFKHVKTIPSKTTTVKNEATEVYEAPDSSAPSNSFGTYPAALKPLPVLHDSEPSDYKPPNDAYTLPKL